MRFVPHRHQALCHGVFAAWLLLTTIVCFSPGEAGMHLFGVHGESSDHHLTKTDALDVSTIIANEPVEACDDAVPATVFARSSQGEAAAHLTAATPERAAADAFGGSRLVMGVVRTSASPPDIRITPLRI